MASSSKALAGDRDQCQPQRRPDSWRVAQVRCDTNSALLGNFDGSSNGTLLLAGGLGGPGVSANPGKFTYWSNSGGTLNDSSNFFALDIHRVAATRTSGAVKIYVNGVQTGSGSGASATVSQPIVVGNLAPSGNLYYLEGLMAEVFVYPSALTPAQLSTIDASESAAFPGAGFEVPYNGAACVQFGGAEHIAMGNILNYECTQSWTAFAAIQLYAGGQAQIIFTNVPPPASGAISPAMRSGFLAASSFPASSTTRASATWCRSTAARISGDGKKHFVAVSYDGSGTAAGVKLYVDGVLETMTTEYDALSGSSSASAGTKSLDRPAAGGGLHPLRNSWSRPG